MTRSLFTLVFTVCSALAVAQTGPTYWQTQAAARGQDDGYRILQLDRSALEADLIVNSTARGMGSLWVPLPDGQLVEVALAPSGVFPAALAAKYPSIRVFSGQSLDGMFRFHGDLTPQGFHGQLMGPTETYYVDPAPEQGADAYLTYARSAYGAWQTPKAFVEPALPELGTGAKEISNDGLQLRAEESYEGTLRTYRIAIAASGEYTIFHGGTKELALAAIVTSLNRVSGIFESEIGIAFTLVENNDEVIYVNVTTDPYSNDSPVTLLSENQVNLDNVIGTANYDIGHVFTTASGGVARLASVCDAGSKAGGTTGTSNPVGDGFDVDFVAHEIGHQMGATHTFNGGSGNCAGGQYSSISSYEPGSASTIMGYANICGTDNIQSFSDDYFHVKSLDQMRLFSRIDGGSTCGMVTQDGNTAPVLTMPSGGWTIPVNTPFALEGAAIDGEGDAITYCWEQFDLGPQGSPNLPVGNAPIFRSFLPSTSPERWFPQQNDVINGTQTFGEKLPSYGRDMRFMLTVRDGKGAASYESISMSVSEDAGPFVVNAPLADATINDNSPVLVTWDVANTNLAPVSAEEVSIELSTDGGTTFAHILTAATVNDGAEYVVIPDGISTTNARIRISAVGNVFFALNPGVFTIEEDNATGISATVAGVPGQVCSPDDAEFTVYTTAVNGYNGTIDVTLEGLGTGLNSSLSASTVSPGDSVVITISNTEAATVGNNDFEVVLSGSGGESLRIDIPLEISAGVSGDLTLVSPINDETQIDTNPTFEWAIDPAAEYYTAELASDSAFTTILAAEPVLFENTWALSGFELDVNEEYYWRVRSVSACGIGDYSTAKFRTINLSCVTADAADLPIAISTEPNVTYESTLSVPGVEGNLYSVALQNLSISHTWISDLTINLVHTDGATATILDNICGSEQNIFASFSDNGISQGSLPCPPVDGETYQPQVPFSAFSTSETEGPWTLQVIDNAPEDGGSINGWSLKVCGVVSDVTLSSTLTDNTTIALNWEAASLTNVSEFEIQVSVDRNAFSTLEVLGGSTFSYTHSGLTLDTEYRYRVRALYGDGGASDYSNLSVVNTPDFPPVAPTGLLVTSALVNQAELTWVDESDNETGFVVERAESADSGFEVLDSTNAGIAFYVDRDPDLVDERVYFYRVAAFNGTGASEYTDVAQIVVTDVPDAMEEVEMVLYPNPGSESVTIELAGAAPTEARVMLFSAQGSQQWSGVWRNTAQGLNVNTSDLAPGIYWLQVQTGEGVFTKQWVRR